MANNGTMKGKIKWFNISRGFGYVIDEDGNEHFVHFSGIEDGRHYTGFNEGDQVEFELESTQRGEKAVHVKISPEFKKGKKEPKHAVADSIEKSEPVE